MARDITQERQQAHAPREGDHATLSEREHAHKLIDSLHEAQLSALVVLLETIVEPEEAMLNHAPIDDEPETDAERLAVAQAHTSLENSGGKGVPHNEAMGRLGLE